MDRRNVLQRFEERLEKVIEQPFGADNAPFDLEALKAHLRAAIEETDTPYVPDRWYVRFPEALRAKDPEVRAWVESVWRSLVASVDQENWEAGVTPQIDVTYDPALTGSQMMVGYEFSVSSGPLYSAAPRSRVRQARDLWDTQVRSRLVPPGRLEPPRGSSPLGTLLKVVAVVSLVLGIGLAIAVVVVDLGRAELQRWLPAGPQAPQVEVQVPRLEWPRVEWPRVEWPSLDFRGVDLPGLFASSAKDYTARNDLRIRKEPTSKAESTGTIARGERLRVMPQQIVQGEAVQGESRWVDITPPNERLTGEHRYIWFGGLEPVR